MDDTHDRDDLDKNSLIGDKNLNVFFLEHLVLNSSFHILHSWQLKIPLDREQIQVST